MWNMFKFIKLLHMICVSEKMLKILKNDLHNLFFKIESYCFIRGPVCNARAPSATPPS